MKKLFLRSFLAFVLFFCIFSFSLAVFAAGGEADNGFSAQLQGIDLSMLDSFLPLLQLVFVALVIIVFLFILFKVFFSKNPSKKIFDRKRALSQELSLAEQKFFKRQISEEDYRQLTQKKQQELIQIDARLSQIQAAAEAKQKAKEEKQKPKQEGVALGTMSARKVDDSKQLLASVEPKDRHVLEVLLKQRQSVQKELDLAQNRYLKRKIDEATYKKVLNSNQEKMIEIEGKIKSLVGTQGAKAVLDEMKKKLKEADSQSKQSESSRIEDIAEEILEQNNRSE